MKHAAVCAYFTLFTPLAEYIFVAAGEVDSDILDHADTVQVRGRNVRPETAKNYSTVILKNESSPV